MHTPNQTKHVLGILLLDLRSVSRFNEISPPWQNFTGLWAYLEGLFSIWQNIQPTKAKCAQGFNVGSGPQCDQKKIAKYL